MATLTSIYRYPVKGLSAEALAETTLTPGELLTGDRAFAIEQGTPQFDPEAPRHFPKVKYLMLMRDEKLAALETSFDDGEQTLTVKRGGKQVCRANLATPVGRGIAEQFFAAYLGPALPGKPRVVQGAIGHGFTDVPERWVSLINLASVRDLERVTGMSVDPLRFRANFYVEGLTPWAEKGWTAGRNVTIGGVSLSMRKAIVRCAATNVNPATAERDMQIPKTLDDAFGANLCGVYLAVETPGAVRIGDPVTAA
ncbi:hypothetical protein sos41_10780 [Alphaproteobacteria bacterium SO-S41]|nr:hypothetical protein sos41_10780 [Alphaproteobacteria bacterium SO-S41]